MIQANELRIGDLFIDKLTKEYLKVSSINDDGKIVYNVINRDAFPLPNGWGAIPIPLTEDILLKCGFKLERGEIILSIPNCGNWNWQLYQYEGYIEIQVQYEYATDLKHIKYLHQLQNLFFALTGEELNIEL